MRYMRSMTMVMAMSLLCAAAAPAALAEPAFVNGLALDGAMLDRSGGIDANTGRVGYFSDIYYDPKRKHWWGLSDRGPGGGTLHYETRVQRFKLDIDKKTGAISEFKIVETIIFKDESGNPLDGIAPNPTSELGNSFDPEGFVVHPKTRPFPGLRRVRAVALRVRSRRHPGEGLHDPRQPDPAQCRDGTPNYADDNGNTAGKRTNRGFEGLAISPDGAYAYAMLQSAMLDEGGGNGVCNRIVKFDTETGKPSPSTPTRWRAPARAAAFPPWSPSTITSSSCSSATTGASVSGAEFSPPNKKVFRIDLDRRGRRQRRAFAAAACPPARSPRPVPSSTSRPTPCPRSATRCRRSGRAWPSARVSRTASYLLLAGTDNDYSVTQNAGGEQFDVYFRFTDADPFVTSIQCPLGEVTGCFYTTGGERRHA